jgi:hypothetical protein
MAHDPRKLLFDVIEACKKGRFLSCSIQLNGCSAPNIGMSLTGILLLSFIVRLPSFSIGD